MFVDRLAAEGLIDKASYSIEENNGKIYINGEEQPGNVYEKHRSFLEQHKGLKIIKSETGLQVQKD